MWIVPESRWAVTRSSADRRRRGGCELSVAGVCVDDDLAVEGRRGGDVGEAIAGHISAMDAAQLLGAGSQMLGRRKVAGPLGEVDGDRAIEVADSEVRLAIAVEVGLADPLRPFTAVGGDLGIADIQPVAEGSQVLKQLRLGSRG